MQRLDEKPPSRERKRERDEGQGKREGRVIRRGRGRGNITVPYLQAPNFFSPLANQGSMINTARNLVYGSWIAQLRAGLSWTRRAFILTQSSVVGGWRSAPVSELYPSELVHTAPRSSSLLLLSQAATAYRVSSHYVQWTTFASSPVQYSRYPVLATHLTTARPGSRRRSYRRLNSKTRPCPYRHWSVTLCHRY